MIRANAALLKLNGYDSEEELLRNFNDVARQWYVDPARRDEFMETIERDGHVLDFVSEIYRHKTRERIWVKEHAHVLRDTDGNVMFYEGTVEDITERRLMEQELANLAFYDALTMLPNRRLLLDRLEQATHSSKRRNSYGALLFLDLNKFKVLNDTHGHAVGDLLLIEVARRLKLVTRETDTVVRLGGDEFVVLIEDLGANVAKATEHATLAERKICESLAKEYVLGDIHHHGSASTGLALFLGDEVDADQIIKNADAAMYAVKRG
jgi:diguanylate cyclase (GGDEF)-like protein/PAS domain S-box-containing protein